MKTFKVILTLCLYVVAVILCMLAIRSARVRPASSAAAQPARARQDELKRQTAEIAGLIAATEARSAVLKAKLGDLQKKSERPSERRVIHISELMEFDPAFRQVVERGMKAKYTGVWEPLFRSMNFSEKEREDFWAIYRDFAERRDDVTQASAKFRMEADNPGIEGMMKQEIDELRRALAGRFGEARESAFFEFLRQMEPRSFADGFAARVAFTEPLTSGQADRIAQIVANATPRYAKGNFADNRNIDWAKVDEDVRGVLSEKQFEAWKEKGLSGRNNGFSREQTEMYAVYEKVLKEEKAAAKE